MLAPGQTIERYTVESVVGQGGAAVVYRVRHNQLGTLHALKIVAVPRPDARERLLQEGRVQAGIRHANVVGVSDVLEIGGSPALLLEYVDGPSLQEWLKRFRPSLADAEVLFRGIVDGVEEAHHHGLVHRDLKPANVLLARSRSGFVPKVTDFGIATWEGAGALAKRPGIVGTPAYMAPEQVRDQTDIDARADLFSLGCILYELVCGLRPFNGPDVLAVFNAVVAGKYLPAEEVVPNLPPPILAAIEGCLESDREKRLQSCHALLATLGGGQVKAGPSRRIQMGLELALDTATPPKRTPRPAPEAPETRSMGGDTLSFPAQNTPTVPTADGRVIGPGSWRRLLPPSAGATSRRARTRSRKKAPMALWVVVWVLLAVAVVALAVFVGGVFDW